MTLDEAVKLVRIFATVDGGSCPACAWHLIEEAWSAFPGVDWGTAVKRVLPELEHWLAESLAERLKARGTPAPAPAKET